MKYCLLSVCLILAFSINSISRKPNSVKDYSVIVQAEIDSSNTKVKLSWQQDTNTYKYFIYKKSVKDSLFGDPYKELPPNTTEFVDDIIRGEQVEYLIKRDAWDYWAYGYLLSGFDIQPVHNRGRVLIICDDSLFTNLSDNLSNLMDDLSGDGWIPHLQTAPRTINFNSQNVLYTKSIIDKYYSEYGDLKSVVLIGRIAVPYSGSFAVDGHTPDHDGAWPTDVFYAVMDGTWTDTITNVKSENQRIRNLPGDGKYDQTIIPASAKIELGRIDLFNLPSFQQSESELIGRYLDNNHKYRNALINVPDSAIVNDLFGLDYREGFAASGWANFAPIVGFDKISDEFLRNSVRTKKYLLAYGSAAGSFNSVALTLYTDELAKEPFNVAFGLFFGSYNGDWDSEDNLLRAIIAAEPFGLTAMWSGRPFWFLHHLGLGYNIGYSTKLSQNSYPDKYPAASPYARRFNHIALMGDPTLRLHYPTPVNNITTTTEKNSITINWETSDSTNSEKYYIYRSDSKYGDYQLLNQVPVSETTYTDLMPLVGFNYYMVRSAKMQYTASGSYMNLSTGKKSNPILFPILNANEVVRVFPVPAKDKVTLISNTDDIFPSIITIYDVNGKQIKSTRIERNGNAPYAIDVMLQDENSAEIATGIYFINIKNAQHNITTKIIKTQY